MKNLELEKIISEYFEISNNEVHVNGNKVLIGSKKYIICNEDEIIEYLKKKLEYNYANIDPSYLSEVTSLPVEIFQLLHEKEYDETVEDLLSKFYPGGLDSFIIDTLNKRGYFNRYHQKDYYKKIDCQFGLIYLRMDFDI